MLASHSPQTLASSSDPLLDHVSLFSGYAWRAFRRRLLIAAVCFAATLGLSVALLALTSPTYEVEIRVLATPTETGMTAITVPSHYNPAKAEPDPTAGIAELAKSRDTLSWLIDDQQLIDRWYATRTRVGRVTDSVVGLLFGRPSRAAVHDALIEILTKRINVTAAAGLITLTVDWHEPQTALLIARSLSQHLLAEVRDYHLNQIRDSVAILQRDLARADADLDESDRRFRAAAEDANAGRALKLHRPTEQPDVETVARLERELTKKREALTRLETAYEARVAAAEQALNGLRSGLGASHPDVLNAERNLELQRQVPEELAVARFEESQLSAQLTRMVPTMAAAGLLQNLAMAQAVNPDLETAREAYHLASESRAQVAGRLGEAQAQLATTDAAFNYRYVITQPPVPPRKPIKPQSASILFASVIGGAFLAFAVAVLADILTKRIQESWQITRFVGLPVLGEVEKS
jgi:uncharacterized protein involved in exopolysaccharide biosynthesis